MPCSLLDLPTELLERVIEHLLPVYCKPSADGLKARKSAVRTLSRLSRTSRRLNAVTAQYLWEHITLPPGYRSDDLPKCCEAYIKTIWWHGLDVFEEGERGKGDRYPFHPDLRRLRKRFPKAHIISYWWTSVSPTERLLSNIKVDFSRMITAPLTDTHLQGVSHQAETIELGRNADIAKLFPRLLWPLPKAWVLHGQINRLILDVSQEVWHRGVHWKLELTLRITQGGAMSETLQSAAEQIQEVVRSLREGTQEAPQIRTYPAIKIIIKTAYDCWDLKTTEDACVQQLEHALIELQSAFQAPQAVLICYEDTSGDNGSVLVIDLTFMIERTVITDMAGYRYM